MWRRVTWDLTKCSVSLPRLNCKRASHYTLPPSGQNPKWFNMSQTGYTTWPGQMTCACQFVENYKPAQHVAIQTYIQTSHVIWQICTHTWAWSVKELQKCTCIAQEAMHDKRVTLGWTLGEGEIVLGDVGGRRQWEVWGSHWLSLWVVHGWTFH